MSECIICGDQAGHSAEPFFDLPEEVCSECRYGIIVPAREGHTMVIKARDGREVEAGGGRPVSAGYRSRS
jgi:hypothetical protein